MPQEADLWREVAKQYLTGMSTTAISVKIKPIADALLLVQGTSFDKLFDQQLSLFG